MAQQTRDDAWARRRVGAFGARVITMEGVRWTPDALRTAVRCLGDVILRAAADRHDGRGQVAGSGDFARVVVLACHRINRTVAHASTYAQAEGLLDNLAKDADSSGALVRMLVEVVASGQPETLPVLCLLRALALFEGSRGHLERAQAPLVLGAMLKGAGRGGMERVAVDVARDVLDAMAPTATR